jgi:hypothetical protein
MTKEELFAPLSQEDAAKLKLMLSSSLFERAVAQSREAIYQRALNVLTTANPFDKHQGAHLARIQGSLSGVGEFLAELNSLAECEGELS